MKRIITVFLALTVALAMSGCGKKNTKIYADQLVDGDVQADAEVDLSKKKPEPTEEQKKEDNVKLDVTNDELGAMIDSFDEEYKSISVMPLESPDFFVGKDLRAVAYVQNHEMSFVYEVGINAKFTEDTLSMSYPDQDGNMTNNTYNVYTVSPEILKTAGGRDYSYVAYGTEEITSDKTDGTIAVMAMVTVDDKVDMGAGKSDKYVMLAETAQDGTYQLFKIEN